jgi:hypothetical protein
MVRKYDETDEEPSEYVYDDDYSDTDHGSLHEEDESIDGYLMNQHENISFDDVNIRPVLMKRLKLGDAVVHIFSNGAIKQDHFQNTSFGFSLAGTPFRTYTIEQHANDCRTYFVHDLVWRAFHGAPPAGWEVRHKPEYTMFARKMYSNALHHLTIFPCTVSKLI